MPHCIFVHKADSIYDDIPAVRYQFPAPYLARARQCVGDWVVYFEPVKVPRSRGYFAVARVEAVVPDPDAPGRWRALIEPGTCLEFAPSVPRRIDGELVERDCPNAQWAVRPLSQADFARITALGLQHVLPVHRSVAEALNWLALSADPTSLDAGGYPPSA